MKKQPEQTARTRQKMINTFWELAEKQGLDNVTISAITKKSGLNRGTFYVYFQNMDDLLEQAEDDIICDLRAKIRTAVDEGGFNNFETVFPKIIDIYAMYEINCLLCSASMVIRIFMTKSKRRFHPLFVRYSANHNI